MSAAVVSSVNTIASFPKTSRNRRSSSSCTCVHSVLVAHHRDEVVHDGRLLRQVVDPLRRSFALACELEAEPRIEVADGRVLRRRQIDAAELGEAALRRGAAKLLENRRLEAAADYTA